MTQALSSTCITGASSVRQQGVGIIEVLVAMVVISLGVLGMAGLQLTGMKQSTNGFNRAKAVMLADNMATRMRINSSGVAEGLYNGFNSTTVNCPTLPNPYCQASEDMEAQSCDASQLAAFDRFSVACGERGSSGTSGGMADLLPANSRMLVVCDDTPCTPDSSYTLSVEWSERSNASAADTDQQTSRVQMRLRP